MTNTPTQGTHWIITASDLTPRPLEERRIHIADPHGTFDIVVTLNRLGIVIDVSQHGKQVLLTDYEFWEDMGLNPPTEQQ